jgi:hypothetical protein
MYHWLDVPCGRLGEFFLPTELVHLIKCIGSKAAFLKKNGAPPHHIV